MADSDEEIVRQVVEVLRGELVPFTEAARRCGVKPERLSKIREDPTVRERMDEARRECLERMQREIRQGTLRRARERDQRSRRPYAERPQITDPEVERRLRDLWADLSLTTGRIAAEFGVSAATVRAWKAKLGLPDRPLGRPPRK